MRWWSSSALGAPLPRALLLLYFLGAWYESFSLLAFTSWMNEAVRMSQWQQNQYYAWTFMPWSLKPLYGLLADGGGGGGASARGGGGASARGGGGGGASTATQ